MENEEIDLIEVMAKLWRRRRTIFRFVLCFLIAGIALAFLLPRKYTAQCTLGLEMEDKTTRISVEGMSAFQSTNVGDVRNARIVSPAMYPDLFFSVPFQKELMYAPLYNDEKGDTVTFYNYLIEGEILPAAYPEKTPSSVERLSPEETKCIEYLKNALSITVNNKEGNLKIAVDMPEPWLAALIADKAQTMLQHYITRLKITRAETALDFIEERYAEVKNKLENKQRALIEFREKQKGRNSMQLETEEKMLNNDYELFFSLYSDIVKQREKARMQVKEDMPVLTVIEPVVEPTSPSKPQRLLIILASVLLGLFIGCGTVLIQPILSEIVSSRNYSHTLSINRMKKIS